MECCLHLQLEPTSLELVEGHGILILKKQLDAALAAAGQSPTKLIRNLMSTYFTPEVLGLSTALGSREKPGLDEDIVSACISKSVKHMYYVHMQIDVGL